MILPEGAALIAEHFLLIMYLCVKTAKPEKLKKMYVFLQTIFL